MKRDAIERLAIDSAAGELNEDADALFRAYLAEHRQANQWAEDVSRLYRQTEAAISTKTAEAHAGRGTPPARRHHPLRSKWPSVARWAAAVIVGTVIGFTAGRWQPAERTYRIAWPEPTRATRQVRTISDLQQKYAGTFWGDKMMALLRQRPAEQYRSGLQGVRLWDRYRQYIKEKNYE
jgi:hypothetical protein